MRLYDDGPVKIQGYASVFGVVYQLGGSLEHIRPGAFNSAYYRVFAAFDHDGWRIGWTGDRYLSLWQDNLGLAFELAVPSTHWGLGLVAGIKRGHFRACSFGDGGHRAVVSDLVNEGGRAVRVISWLNVAEVSICPAGANPEACCWVDAENPADLPPHVRRTRARWYEGRVQVQLAARAARTQAHARTAHPVPASVRAVLARGRPKGWMSFAEGVARELLPS